MGSTPVAGELLAIGELAPGRIALEFRAQSLIAGLRPGHALHLVRPESGGYRLRRVAPVSRVDLIRGSVEVALQPRADGGQDALAGLRVGGQTMQANVGVPVEIVLVIQALVVLFIAAPDLVKRIFRLRNLQEASAMASKGWNG